MNNTRTSFPVVMLVSLMSVNTGYAYDSLTQVGDDIMAGAKIGCGSALVVAVGTFAANKATKNVNFPYHVAGVINSAPVPAVVLVALANTDKLSTKESSWSSFTVKSLATFVTYYVTQCVLQEGVKSLSR